MSIAEEMILKLQQENRGLRAENERLKAEPEQCKLGPIIEHLLDLLEDTIDWQEDHLHAKSSDWMRDVVRTFRKVRPRRRRGKLA